MNSIAYSREHLNLSKLDDPLHNHSLSAETQPTANSFSSTSDQEQPTRQPRAKSHTRTDPETQSDGNTLFNADKPGNRFCDFKD